MILRPANKQELARALSSASTSRSRVTGADLSSLNRIIHHTPGDLTVRVEAGISLATLQAALALAGQWLPIDPPAPDRLTVADLLAGNLSGPRRLGYGTIRDHL